MNDHHPPVLESPYAQLAELEKRLRQCEGALLLGCDWTHPAIRQYLDKYPEPYADAP